MRLALFSALKTNQNAALDCTKTKEEVDLHVLSASLEGDVYINSKVNSVYNHKISSKVSFF